MTRTGFMNKKQTPVTGNRVCFVGGPEAGRVRVIPESVGQYVKSEGDFIYRLVKMQMPGHSGTAYFACSADQHPMDMFMEMWREYAASAQIKAGISDLTYNRAQKS